MSLETKLKKKLCETLERAVNESTPMPALYPEVVEQLNDPKIANNLLLKIPKYENLKKNFVQTQESFMRS